MSLTIYRSVVVGLSSPSASHSCVQYMHVEGFRLNSSIAFIHVYAGCSDRSSAVVEYVVFAYVVPDVVPSVSSLCDSLSLGFQCFSCSVTMSCLSVRVYNSSCLVWLVLLLVFSLTDILFFASVYLFLSCILSLACLYSVLLVYFSFLSPVRFWSDIVSPYFVVMLSFLSCHIVTRHAWPRLLSSCLGLFSFCWSCLSLVVLSLVILS